MEDDRFTKLRSIPDYLEGRGRSAYLRSPHPYPGSIAEANREYADDLRAVLRQLDLLRAELDAVYQDRARDTIKATEQIVRLVADLKRKEEALREADNGLAEMGCEESQWLRPVIRAALSSEPTDTSHHPYPFLGEDRR